MIHVENCNGYVQIYSSVIYINNHNNNLKRKKWSKEAGMICKYKYDTVQYNLKTKLEVDRKG